MQLAQGSYVTRSRRERVNPYCLTYRPWVVSGWAMGLIETLRKQSKVLRSLATDSETKLVRENLLSLIDRCGKLADDAAREVAESRPKRGSD